jgi:lysophospholipase L1-like esterase
MDDKEKKSVVCLGASIVQGRISSNFIDILKEKMESDGFSFINRGIAGYQSYNIVTGLDDVIKLQPEFIVILVGTNDVTAALNPQISGLARLTNKTPQPPSPQFYYDNMLRTVRTLKEKTAAKIGIASITVLGEDLDSPENRLIREYNALLKKIATAEQISYLPVFEKQEEYLRTNLKAKGRPFKVGIMPSLELMMRHFLLRQSFDAISVKKGYLLLTDGIHMNSRGAELIAGEVETFLHSGI